MPEVVTIGETMIRMVPLSTGPLRYAELFQRKTGGAESNLAVGVVRLGHTARWISRVGNDEFGKHIVSLLRGEGVDVSCVRFCDDRPTGLFFNERWELASTRNLYYRHFSAATLLSPEDIRQELIAGAKFLYLTGITPALSESCREMTSFAMDVAKKEGVKVCFDPNIRLKLWSDEAAARKTILHLIERADLLLLGKEEALFLLGDEKVEKLSDAFLRLGPSIVAIRAGKSGAYVAEGQRRHWIPGFPIEKEVDPLGAGDAFDAGFIVGLLEGFDLVQSARLANAVGAYAVTAVGNIEALPTMEEVRRFMEGKEQISR